jgi:hypothetical protein
MGRVLDQLAQHVQPTLLPKLLTSVSCRAQSASRRGLSLQRLAQRWAGDTCCAASVRSPAASSRRERAVKDGCQQDAFGMGTGRAGASHLFIFSSTG